LDNFYFRSEGAIELCEVSAGFGAWLWKALVHVWLRWAANQATSHELKGVIK
jgi:hypothetical protein